MIATDLRESAPPADAARFVVPRDARLSAGMLNPFRRTRPLPAPFDRPSTVHLFWARNAVYQGLRALGLERDDVVLVPSFHCTSVVEPILRYGARVRFYAVRRDGLPDFDDLTAAIDARTRAVLTIHYLGFPQPIGELRALADARGLALIEDCAHVLTGRCEARPFGTTGDIALFSVRKFLPVYDGGQLVVNRGGVAVPRLEPPSLLFRARVLTNTLEKLVRDSPSPAARGIERLLRSAVGRTRQILSGRRPDSVALAINNYDTAFDPRFVTMPMSALSRRILAGADFEAIAAARRRNYERLAEGLSAFPEIEPFHRDLPPDVCPWVFPFFARGWRHFHRHLRARGIPAITWGDVVHPQLPLHDFPDTAWLYERLAFLPVHQSLTNDEIGLMVETVGDVLRRAR